MKYLADSIGASPAQSFWILQHVQLDFLWMVNVFLYVTGILGKL